MDPIEQQQSIAVTHALLVQIFNRMNIMEERLGARIDGPKAVLTVGEAVDRFRSYLAGTAKPENYDYLLTRFVVYFTRERQFPEITATEIKQFIETNWPGDTAARLNTRAQRLTQLNGLWSHNIMQQRMDDLPVFNNPCDLVRFERTLPDPPEFLPAARFAPIIREAPDDEALLFMIPMSGGLRVKEIILLRPCDIVDRRILMIQDAKSKRTGEFGVIPAPVADLLDRYIQQRYIRPDQRIFDVRRQNAGNVIYKWAGRHGLDISIHDLRKWCATFWENVAGDKIMADVVLRHAPDANSKEGLRKRYVAPLKPAEIMERQDRSLTPLFEKGGDLWRRPSSDSSDCASSDGP